MRANNLELWEIVLRNDVHNELTPSRKRRDNLDEEKLASNLWLYNVFIKDTASPKLLQNITTKEGHLRALHNLY